MRQFFKHSLKHSRIHYSQIPLRIWIPLQLNNSKVKIKIVLLIPEIVHNLLRDLDAISPSRTHRRIINLNFRFRWMMQRNLLLIPFCLFARSKILRYNPHTATLLMSLYTPKHLVFNLRPPKRI